MIMRWKVSCSGDVLGVWDHNLSYVWQSNTDKHHFETACIPRWIGVFSFLFHAEPNRRYFHDYRCICAVFCPWSDATACGTAVCWFQLNLRNLKRYSISSPNNFATYLLCVVLISAGPHAWQHIVPPDEYVKECGTDMNQHQDEQYRTQDCMCICGTFWPLIPCKTACNRQQQQDYIKTTM